MMLKIALAALKNFAAKPTRVFSGAKASLVTVARTIHNIMAIVSAEHWILPQEKEIETWMRYILLPSYNISVL
jgi:hypothetical protein